MTSHEILIWMLAILTGYLVGSIPTAYIFGKWLKGIDIREHGSKNVGATNVMRVVGKVPGFITLAIDIIKGVIAVIFVAGFFERYLSAPSGGLHLACGIAAICGHNWTCFLSFKGGKGIATSAGVFLGLVPLVALGLVVVWGVTALLTRFVSVASIAASMALPILLFVFDKPIEWVITGFILSLVSIWKHRSNIKRLLSGTENRMGSKEKTTGIVDSGL